MRALLAKGRIVGNQGIHTACTNAGKKPGTSHDKKIVSVLPARLTDKTCTKAVGYQKPRKQHYSKGWMVHIGVTRYEQNIKLFPAKGVKLSLRHGKKTRLLKLAASMLQHAQLPTGYGRSLGMTAESLGGSMSLGFGSAPGMAGIGPLAS